MKYLSIQTFQCGISVSGLATFTGGAEINILSLNGATTSSEASLFLGAHGTNEGGQLVLQKGTSNTYAAHLDNYADQFRLLYGTNTGSAGVALAVSLSTRQLILPAYTSTSSFSGTAVGYLAFDSAGNVITVPSPAGAVTSIIAGTGVSVSSATGNVTISIGQSVATSAQVTFDSVITNNNGNGTNIKIGDDAWIGDVNAANTFRVTGAQNGANGYIIFGNANSDALGRSGTGNLTYAGSTVWTAATLTDLSQLTNGPGYITSAALSGYVPTSRTLTINGTSYDLSANRTWTINTVDYTSRLQHQVKAGVAINKGQAVYVTSADGTNMIVGLASNASEATSSKTMGLLDATVSTNGFANVVTEGLLAGLDTSTAGAEGDPVWLGTGGNLIYGLANKPYAPAHLVFIGIVTRKNANNGEIFVKVQNGFELNEIHDVDLKTTVPVNGHILGFDGTLWVNKTIAGWLGYTPANASGTTNYISKFTGSTTLGNSQIYDDGSNVGIGTTSPNSKLSIGGGDNGSGVGVLELFTSGGTNLKLGGNFDYSWIQSHSSKPLRINELGNNVILNLGGGNVGIGTTAPSYKLDVNGETRLGKLITTWSNSPITPSAVIYSESGYNTVFAGNGQFSSSYLALMTTGNMSYMGGNVGIGTVSPGAKLHIDSSTQQFKISGNSNDFSIYNWGGGVNVWSSENLYFGRDAATANKFFFQNGGATATTLYINTATERVGIGTSSPMRALNIVSNNAQIRISDSTAPSTNYWEFSSVYFNTNQDLFISNQSVTALTINSSGNVGMGTTNPGAKLHLYGSGATELRIGSSTGNTNSLLSFYEVAIASWGIDAGQANGSFFIKDLYNTRTVVTLNNSGNVGIGTTSPSATLSIQTGVSDSSGNAFLFTGYNSKEYVSISKLGFIRTRASDLNGANMHFLSNDGANRVEVSASNTAFNWYSHALATTFLTFQHTTGNIGIGTTSPSTKLDVSGDTFVRGVIFGYAGGGNQFGGLTWDSTDSGILFLKSSNVTQVNINSSGNSYFNGGNVGIGITSPSYKLQVNADGAGLYVLGANTAPYTQTIASFVYGGNSNSINIENQAGKASIQARAGGSTMDLLLNPVSGNVGIGTGSPAAKLDVNGSIYAVGDITIRQSGSSSLSLYRANSGYQAVTHYWEGSGLYWAAGMGYNTYNWVINDTNYGVNNKFVVTQGSTWGVGIGASEPLARLHVGANLSDLSSHTFPNTGAIIASIGVDQTAARTNVLSLLRDGTSGVVYGGLAAFDMSRWQSDGVSTRVQLDLRLSNTDTADIVDVMSWRSNGNVGIGTTSPSQLLHVAGNIRVTGAFYDSNNQAGTSGQILKSTGTGTDWVSLSEITGVDGSGTANYVTKWSDADTVTNSLIYDNGTNVGIGTTSPGYNFDVNGQVRVQDKLRVGTVNSGNGVVHMSSSATINPNTTTIVWAQNVSVGMCAFIEYYILNNNSLTDQRAGTIMVTWNQSGTPTIAHTETTTPDIGSTTSINFTSSLVGADARINAVNSSANPYTIVMSYKYF